MLFASAYLFNFIVIIESGYCACFFLACACSSSVFHSFVPGRQYCTLYKSSFVINCRARFFVVSRNKSAIPFILWACECRIFFVFIPNFVRLFVDLLALKSGISCRSHSNICRCSLIGEKWIIYWHYMFSVISFHFWFSPHSNYFLCHRFSWCSVFFIVDVDSTGRILHIRNDVMSQMEQAESHLRHIFSLLFSIPPTFNLNLNSI